MTRRRRATFALAATLALAGCVATPAPVAVEPAPVVVAPYGYAPYPVYPPIPYPAWRPYAYGSGYGHYHRGWGHPPPYGRCRGYPGRWC